jgi:hypothetical protein
MEASAALTSASGRPSQPPATPPPPVRTDRQALQDQCAALDATYQANLQRIEAQYTAALQATDPQRPRQRHRARRDASRKAQRQQQAVYKQAKRDWAALSAQYQQWLLTQQAAQP